MYDQTSIYPGKYHEQNDATRTHLAQPVYLNLSIG